MYPPPRLSAWLACRLALYTDADVLFMGKPGQDLSTCSMPRPQLLMVSPQGRRGTPTNSGVLLFNVPAWRAELPRLVRFGREGRFDFPAHDQGDCWKAAVHVTYINGDTPFRA